MYENEDKTEKFIIKEKPICIDDVFKEIGEFGTKKFCLK